MVGRVVDEAMRAYYDRVRPSTTTGGSARGCSPAASGPAGRRRSRPCSPSSRASAPAAGSTSRAAPASSRATCAATSPASTRARRWSRSPPRALPGGRAVQGDAVPLPFADDAFDRVFTANFYGHLLADERAAFLAEARRVAPALVVLDAALQPGGAAEEWQERKLNDGSRHRVYKRFFTPEGLAARSAAAGCPRRALVRDRRHTAGSRAMTWTTTGDPEAFLDAAGAFLRAAPAANSVTLTTVEALRARGADESGGQRPAAARRGGRRRARAVERRGDAHAAVSRCTSARWRRERDDRAGRPPRDPRAPAPRRQRRGGRHRRVRRRVERADRRDRARSSGACACTASTRSSAPDPLPPGSAVVAGPSIATCSSPGTRRSRPRSRSRRATTARRSTTAVSHGGVALWHRRRRGRLARRHDPRGRRGGARRAGLHAARAPRPRLRRRRRPRP